MCSLTLEITLCYCSSKIVSWTYWHLFEKTKRLSSHFYFVFFVLWMLNKLCQPPNSLNAVYRSDNSIMYIASSCEEILRLTGLPNYCCYAMIGQPLLWERAQQVLDWDYLSWLISSKGKLRVLSSQWNVMCVHCLSSLLWAVFSLWMGYNQKQNSLTLASAY